MTLPPGPRSPASWQLLRYTLFPLQFLEQCGARYGDPFTVRMAGYGKFVFLSSPDAIRDVFRADSHALHSGEGNEFLSLTVGKSSVLVLDDEPHDRQRRILLPPLKGERMRSFFTAMQQATLDVIASWPLDKPFRADDGMRRITQRVILQATLGLPVNERLKQLETLIERLMKHTSSRYSLILLKAVPRRVLMSEGWWNPYLGELSKLHAALDELIREMRSEPAEQRADCVLSDLLTATDDTNRPIPPEQVRDAVMTILIAGFETTSVALAWALEQIVPRPAVVDEIEHELHHVCGSGLPAAEHLADLDYLDAVIRESLRLRTVIPFVIRLTKQPYVAGGIEYPPGIFLCPCSHLVHRRADIYADPETFRPERFLEQKFSPTQWFPFGGGSRMCLGMAFALYEMKVVLATIFATTRLLRPERSQSNPLRRGLIVSPSDGVQLILTQQAPARSAVAS